MKKYIDELILEYQNANYNMTSGSELIKWLKNKEKHLANYYAFIEYYGLNIGDLTVEFNSGEYDTLGIVIPKTKNIVSVGDFSQTIKLNNVTSYSGTIKFNPLFIVNKNKPTDIDLPNFKNYVLDLNKYSNKIIVKDCASYIDDNLFIGIYGSVYDRDNDKKNNELTKLKKELEIIGNRPYIEEKAIVYDTYMHLIKPKHKIYSYQKKR